jgi:RimJ/RimL family protein N-acetyltransferase
MISLHRFSEISAADWVRLLNDHEVHRHMPLGGDAWTEPRAAEWAAGKDAQWTSNGYGPWAIRMEGVFAGWGGFQKEETDADFGLVLLPEFWGRGMEISREIIGRGWSELGLESISILLPPSRTRMKGLGRMGFQPDGELEYAGHRFLKFRMMRP